jgi:hypothetical protein
MSRIGFKVGSKARELGPVRERFCQGDPASTEAQGSAGLIDEVVLKAQAKTHATYIGQANFMSDGACVELTGVAMAVE